MFSWLLKCRRRVSSRSARFASVVFANTRVTILIATVSPEISSAAELTILVLIGKKKKKKEEKNQIFFFKIRAAQREKGTKGETEMGRALTLRRRTLQSPSRALASIAFRGGKSGRTT